VQCYMQCFSHCMADVMQKLLMLAAELKGACC